MSSARRVLIISFFYPPANAVGAVRVSKFTRYLADFGWEPHVLTARVPDAPAGLAVEIQPDQVHRSGFTDVNRLPQLVLGRKRVVEGGYEASRGPFRYLGYLYKQFVNFPDGQVGWYPHAVRRGLELLRQLRPAVIFSSALPLTSHLIAYRLSRLSGLPWVAEYRDLVMGNPGFRRVFPLNRVEEWLERRILRQASAVVTISQPLASALQAQTRAPVFLVPNGFDPADYPDQVEPLEKFTLTYTGMLYYSGRIHQSLQDPRPLFTAIEQLRDAGVIDANRFALRFVGRYMGALKDEIAQRQLNDLVTIHAPVPHQEALRLQQESAAVVALISDQYQGWSPTKLFEYMGAGRPVLLVGPKGNVGAQLVQHLQSGVVSDDPVEIAQTVRNWLEQFTRAGQLSHAADEAAIRSFHRQALTGRLATILDHVWQGSIHNLDLPQILPAWEGETSV